MALPSPWEGLCEQKSGEVCEVELAVGLGLVALVLPGNNSGEELKKQTCVEKVSQLAPLLQDCRLSCGPSPPLAVVALPRQFSASSLVVTQKKFLVRTLIPLKNVPCVDGCVKVQMK